MSLEQISRSQDLQRLQYDGYEIEIRDNHLILHSVPYVNAQREIALGVFVSTLELTNDVTRKPSDHQVWFSGDQPCNYDGSPLLGISARKSIKTILPGLEVRYQFSCKPVGGYEDYYMKMTRYVEIISNQAKAISNTADARTHKVIESQDTESVFNYADTASSRVGITNITKKLEIDKIAIIGLGGTGSYLFDLIAKTPVKEIHLFDGDIIEQHCAFRAPGAISRETLDKHPLKVEYYANLYGHFRSGIFAHAAYIDIDNVNDLRDFDFVFVCVDNSLARKVISDYLHKNRIPFIDTGMEIGHIEECASLFGACRVTLSTPEKSKHFSQHVSLGENRVNDIYRSNIQVADLNALSAAMAVIKWKKYCGFYQDLCNEHQSVYAINAHQLTQDETDADEIVEDASEIDDSELA